MIRSFIEEFKGKWDLLLPLIEFTINTSESEITKYTPFFLWFGCHPNYPLISIYRDVYCLVITTDEYVKLLRENRDAVIDWVVNKRAIAAGKMAKRYNEKNKTLIKEIPLELEW